MRPIYRSDNQALMHETDYGKDYFNSMTAMNEFQKIAMGIADIVTEKNKRYGNSALEPVSIFSGKTAVGDRIDDKLSRIKNADELRKNDIADVVGYCILICKENNWTNFNDLID